MYFVFFLHPPPISFRPIQFRCRYINLLGARFRFRVSPLNQKVETVGGTIGASRISSSNNSLLTGASNSIAWHDIHVKKIVHTHI